MNDSKKFTQRPNWLFQTKLSPTAREVYTVLLSHAWGDKTEVYPSVDRIAEMAGVGRFAAYEALHVLEGVGMVIIDGSAGSNRYTINRRPSKADVERICGLSKAEIQSLRRYDTVRKPNTELGPECSDSKLNAVCYPNGVCLESEHEVDERNRRRELDEESLAWAAMPRPPSEKVNPASPGSEDEGSAPGTARSAEGDRPRAAHENSGTMNSTPNYFQRPSALVELFNSCRVENGFGPGSNKVRNGSWLDSARILLNQHPYDELTDLIRWVCEDDYWSKEVSSLYALGIDPKTKKPRYDDLLAESQRREPKSASRSARQSPWSNPTPEAMAAADRAASGLARLEDLGGPDITEPSPDAEFRGLREKLLGKGREQH